ncbi:FUSC family protein [Leucobacter massiliensis]|uniref:FUSC family protein n=1 Tax=Leucobacter massiliensis TaxID=1686285 RepID=A0A2S9QQK3_9MICO|nr:FUSC family protein [Leucobacter massiliensis]
MPDRLARWGRAPGALTSRVRAERRVPLIQVVKTLAAMILSWFLCLLVFPGQLPIFGAIAALLVVQDNVNQSLSKGLERVVGVLLGVGVALLTGEFLGQHSWLFIAALVAGLALGWLLSMTPSAANQIVVSALLMIALGGLDLQYGVERVVETLIGALIGVGINALVVAPVRTLPVHEAIIALAEDAATALRRIADALDRPRDDDWLERMHREARALQAERARVHTLLREARESLRLNPRSRRFRQGLAADDALFQRLQPIVTQIGGMSRAVYDLYEPDLVTDPSVIGMVEELRRAAHDLERLVRPALPGSEPPEPPALTAPYTIPQPHPEHWVLIGSLMEDLRRVRGRITGELD